MDNAYAAVMVDLVVINPGGGDVIYQQLDDELTAIEPPLWARLVAEYCRERGHTVEIWDRQVQISHMSRPALYAVAAYGHQPSASTQSMEDVTNVVRDIKRIDRNQPIIVLGGHAAALPHRTLGETGADYVCTGEGPVTVEGLLCRLKGDLVGVRGLLCKDQLAPNIPTKPAPLLDPGDLHGDCWDLLPMDRYRAHNWQCFDGSPRTPYASIYTTLGCPYRCVFCCINAPFGGPGYRRRDPLDVVNEVAYLHENYGVSTFKITDEMFVLNQHHYLAICEMLAQLPYADDLNIWAYARVDTVKPDHLAVMRRAGIRWLALGIESGSAFVRDGADKSLDESDIAATVKAIQDAGINVIGNFIFGLPDDTVETMTDTLLLAQQLNCEFANFYSAMAYPGSKLFDDADPADLPARWSGYSQHSADCTPLPTATMTSRQVLAFRDMAFESYFGSDRYLEMIDRKFGAVAVDQIKRMTDTKLERVTP